MRALLWAMRPKTLSAALVPVWSGTVLAREAAGWADTRLAAWALASATAIQVATNLFNDALDHRQGADTSRRLGPLRVTAGGLMSARAVLALSLLFLMVAAACALPLVAARGWPILAIGVPSLYFSFGYTGGPWPLAYRGLGEFFVLLFFGWVAVAGSVFVACGRWLWPESLLLGTQVGLLSVALIAINNLRDVEEDALSGKRTLAVRLGRRFARAEITFALLAPPVLGLLWWERSRGAALVPLLLLPLGAALARGVWAHEPGRIYNRFLALAGAQLLGFALSFHLGWRLP